MSHRENTRRQGKYGMNPNGNIQVYRRMDPDSIYYKYPNGSLTWFFVPESGQLFVKPYPIAHHDMLADDDDVFQAVFPDQPMNSRTRRELSSRGQALAHGQAILGRIGMDGMTPLIAFWPSARLNTAAVGGFLNALYKKFPAFKGYQDTSVLLLPGQDPITVAAYTGVETPRPPAERTIALRPKPQRKPRQKTFVIAGQKYTLSDLQAMRAAIHTKGVAGPGLDSSVLCHPDMEKYPELAGYKPASCGDGDGNLRATHPQKWRQAGWQAGIPYVYTPEHRNFRNWLGLREALQIS